MTVGRITQLSGHGYQPKAGTSAPSKVPSGGSAGQRADIQYLGDVQRLQLRPGDILVLSVDEHITVETGERLRDMVQQVCGTDQKVFVLSRGMKFGVLAKEVD